MRTGVLATDDTTTRVLVVDDSAFMRLMISKFLNETPGMEVVGIARDGLEALDLITELDPDVVTLDIEMPRMDGLSALRHIMRNKPRPVIMLSSLTKEGARETIQALTIGAVDFITKPTAQANISVVKQELVTKIHQAMNVRVRPPLRAAQLAAQPPPTKKSTTRPLSTQDKVVVIGTSTGGPRALSALLPQLPKDLPAAVLIVQHMPEGFTFSLAERLNDMSAIKIKEAQVGDQLEAGLGLLAPGGHHMVVDQNDRIDLNKKPTIHGVRPSVDATLVTVAERYKNAVVSVILTGMGRDGTNGSALVHGSGGWVIAEDESTSVVWGMPRSVVEAGVADIVLPLQEVAGAIVQAVKA